MFRSIFAFAVSFAILASAGGCDPYHSSSTAPSASHGGLQTEERFSSAWYENNCIQIVGPSERGAGYSERLNACREGDFSVLYLVGSRFPKESVPHFDPIRSDLALLSLSCSSHSVYRNQRICEWEEGATSICLRTWILPNGLELSLPCEWVKE